MNPTDHVIGRLQEISDRIAQIQAQSKLPPSLRDANAAAANSPAAPASAATANAAATDTAAVRRTDAAEVDRFQTLLDQALSLSDTDPVSGAVSGALSGATSTDDLQRYQEMLLQAIREASGSNDADA